MTEPVSTAPERARHRAVIVGFVGGMVVVLVLAGALWLLFGPHIGSLRGPLGRAVAPNVLSAQERRGEEIYNANCITCHGGPTGGAMMDYPPRHNANGHTWHHPDCELKQIVRVGGDEMTDMMRQMMAPPDAPKMQAFGDKLSNDEIEAVLAFIKTMWTPEEREVQAQITQEECPVAGSGS